MSSSKFVPSETTSRKEVFRAQLRYMCRAAEQLDKAVEESQEDVPAWVEQQTALAASNLGMALSYARKLNKKAT